MCSKNLECCDNTSNFRLTNGTNDSVTCDFNTKGKSTSGKLSTAAVLS
ncbi:hypothetical protein T12_11953 [Trichinella patagoniensis]|uniref:Uncharacterized protein n=1 Tax=Trichinella patagoniensis TaxID=990121 RepID=A0A0V0YTK8_9BILA|nr:hypothetical protein T12_11953 [Trichinella patagoniensis]